jgi:hypothetical protein
MTRRETGQPPPEGPSPVGTLIYLMAGLIVWGLQFTVVYGSHVLLCLSASPGRLVGTVVTAVTVLAAAALTAFLVWQRRAADLLGVEGDGEWKTGSDRIARVVTILSIIAILWTGWTVLIIDSCAYTR